MTISFPMLQLFREQTLPVGLFAQQWNDGELWPKHIAKDYV
jgi:hypothetical protein